MVVFVVFQCGGSGSIAGVFSSRDRAISYVEAHPYGGYIISEHTVD